LKVTLPFLKDAKPPVAESARSSKSGFSRKPAAVANYDSDGNDYFESFYQNEDVPAPAPAKNKSTAAKNARFRPTFASSEKQTISEEDSVTEGLKYKCFQELKEIRNSVYTLI
jgi:hypothetical protein